MKKIITIFGIFGLTLIQAQVGINTDDPNATLDVNKNPNLTKETPQGLIIPRLTTAERSDFTDVEEGMMIYNITKKCIEVFYGIDENGIAQWGCATLEISKSSDLSKSITISPAGFEGNYIDGIAMTPSNKVKFKLKNNSSIVYSNLDFSDAVSIVNGSSNVATATGENNNVTLGIGTSIILSYTLTGTPVEGTLTANFDKLNLKANQSTPVDIGYAVNIPDKIVYVASTEYNGKIIQGKINDSENSLSVDIPYIGGQGAYNEVSSTQTTEPGHGGDVNNLTLNIPAGTFYPTGNLNATITAVDGDHEYLVKHMAPGEEYTIATFPITMGSTNFNVIVKGIGGIPDRNFGDGIHDFIYLPVSIHTFVPELDKWYIRTWLNMNLGAEYANINSPHFNPNINKTGDAAHKDSKTFGSLFQWQRKAEQHEFRNSNTTVTLASSFTAQGIWDEQFILPANFTHWVIDVNNVPDSDLQLWQIGGANNPCPVGYHVPTFNEWRDFQSYAASRYIGTNTEYGSELWNQTILPNLSAAGVRSFKDGGLLYLHNYGAYWSSTHRKSDPGGDSEYAFEMFFNRNSHFIGDSYYNQVGGTTSTYNQSGGLSIRCIND